MKTTVAALPIKQILQEFIKCFEESTENTEILTGLSVKESMFLSNTPSILLLTSGYKVSQIEIVGEEFRLVDFKYTNHTWYLTQNLSKVLNHTPEIQMDFGAIKGVVNGCLQLLANYDVPIDELRLTPAEGIYHTDFNNYIVSKESVNNIRSAQYNYDNLNSNVTLNSFVRKGDPKGKLPQKYYNYGYPSGTFSRVLGIRYM